ncbi:MAG: ROK family protein [Acholeplasmataceae bacterium]
MSKYVYGIDVGGTSIKIGLFDFNTTKLINSFEVKTPNKDDGKVIFETIYKNILDNNHNQEIELSSILGVGIDVPCPVKNGYVESCANLHIANINLIDEMKKYLPGNMVVTIANDATIAAYGENASLDKPYNNAVLITLGTGVGGGVILDGKIVEGSTGFAGEIGHIKVYDESDKVCGCGSKGCLEQICGTEGILDYTKKLLISQSSMLDTNNLSVKSIFDAAKVGDEVALETIHRVAKYIGIASSIISMVIEPDIFIIGGGVSKAGDFLLELIQKYYKENARFSTGKIPFKLAQTGNDAGMIGSALLVKSLIATE